jgi:hypothetical protein
MRILCWLDTGALANVALGVLTGNLVSYAQ